MDKIGASKILKDAEVSRFRIFEIPNFREFEVGDAIVLTSLTSLTS